MFERFGTDVRRVVVRAVEEEARALGARTVEAEHLLLALSVADDLTARLLVDAGLGHAELRRALELETERSLAAVGVDVSGFDLPDPPTPARRPPRLGASAKRALERAAQVGGARKDRRISSAHLLVGVLRAEVGTVPRALAAAEQDRIALLVRAEGLLG